uniref:chaperone protein dnaJ 49-like n=1 Tax=Erigeron canadensis TaxID=72917 RepID=UPI001CB93C49|nr:chaperone protein dnaJ 49-like [Erigeron canadensis]
MAENDGETVVLIPPSNKTVVVEPLSLDRPITQLEEEGGKACQCMPITLSIVMFTLLFGGLYVAHQQQYSYSLEKSDKYRDTLKTTDYGIEFYVYSLNMFNHNYPLGSFARDAIEIIGEYKHSIQKHCGDELKHRIRFLDFPTPFCDELERMS